MCGDVICLTWEDEEAAESGVYSSGNSAVVLLWVLVKRRGPTRLRQKMFSSKRHLPGEQ